MAWQKIQIKCQRCNGTGIISPDTMAEETKAEVSCPLCDGNKYLPWGRLKVESEE